MTTNIQESTETNKEIEASSTDDLSESESDEEFKTLGLFEAKLYFVHLK